MPSQKDIILKRLDELGALAKRSLGQNFLIDANIIAKIVDEVERIASPKLVEVGPGLGSLTDSLDRSRLSLIELDSNFASYWQNEGYKVIEADALKYDWHSFTKDDYTLVSNLPYQISSRLVVQMCLSGGPEAMVLMFQKEVAERIISPCGNKNYGYLSVIAQSYWNIYKLCDVSSNCFYPRPKIESRVLTFTKKQSWRDPKQAKRFSNLVKASFAQRRKKLLSNLKKFSKTCEWEQIFTDLNWDCNLRAEALSVEDFWTLYDCAVKSGLERL